MIAFVSDARRDDDVTTLRGIERLLRFLGQPYIHDLHHHTCGTERHEIVEAALREAVACVAIASPHYLQTNLTRKEFGLALGRGLPMPALSPSATWVSLRPGGSSRYPVACPGQAAPLSVTGQRPGQSAGSGSWWCAGSNPRSSMGRAPEAVCCDRP